MRRNSQPGGSCCQASSGLVLWRSEAGCMQYCGIFAPHPAQLLGRWLKCRDWCVAVGKRTSVSLSCDSGQVPGVSVHPPDSQTRTGRELSSAGLEVWFHLPWLEVSLLSLLSRALFWRGVLGGLVRGGVQEAGPLLAVEGGGRRRVGWAGGVQQKRCAAAALCPRGPAATSPAAPASEGVEGLQGRAGGRKGSGPFHQESWGRMMCSPTRVRLERGVVCCASHRPRGA